MQRLGVLDYAPSSGQTFGQICRAVVALMILPAFIVLGAIVGSLLPRVAFSPVYSSSAFMYFHAPGSLFEASFKGPQPIQFRDLVAAALKAARTDPSCRSLPTSVTDACDHATFGNVPSSYLFVTYEDCDSRAAGCMTREMVKAYSNAFNASHNQQLILEAPSQPSAGVAVRSTGIHLLGGLLGGIGGAVAFGARSWLRKRSLNRAT